MRDYMEFSLDTDFGENRTSIDDYLGIQELYSWLTRYQNQWATCIGRANYHHTLAII